MCLGYKQEVEIVQTHFFLTFSKIFIKKINKMLIHKVAQVQNLLPSSL